MNRRRSTAASRSGTPARIDSSRELDDRGRREREARHRGRFEHGPLGLGEPVETGRQQRQDRRRNVELGAGVGVVEHRGHLLHEQRVAVGCGHDPVEGGRVHRTAREQPLGHRGGIARAAAGRARSGRGRRPRPGRRAGRAARAGRCRPRRMGARTRSTTLSISSSRVGSAQCRSSITTTRGRSAARISNRRRTPQNVSSTAYTAGMSPMADATRSATSASLAGEGERPWPGRRRRGSSSAIAAAERTASASGQNVIPSP